MTNTNVTHDPQRVLADLRAALEDCKRERDALRAALKASDALVQHVNECSCCSERSCAEMFWDEGVCPRLSKLIEVESSTRTALQPERTP